MKRLLMDIRIIPLIAVVAVLGFACGGSDEAASGAESLSVRLNEIDCQGRDWIELKNLDADNEIDLSGYILSDDLDEEDHRFVFPDGTRIPADGYLYVRGESDDDSEAETESAASDADSEEALLPFGIKCGKDTIVFATPNEEVIDRVALPVVADRKTYARLPDGIGAWAESDPSRGASNADAVPTSDK